MPAVRYGAVAMILHWLVALGILALIVIGLIMTHAGLGPMTKFRLYQLHKSVGVTVLLAAALRILWQLTHRPPPLPDGMPLTERKAAAGAHLGLYVLMLFLPLTGWALVSASPLNIPTILFGLVPWPHLPVLSALENKAPVEHALKLLHGRGAWLLIVLIAVHAGAVLRHHFILRDGIMQRMLPLGRADLRKR
jgi:cytochrome b561